MANEPKESRLQSSLQYNYQGMYGYTNRNHECSAFTRSAFNLPSLGIFFHDPADVTNEVL